MSILQVVKSQRVTVSPSGKIKIAKNPRRKRNFIDPLTGAYYAAGLIEDDERKRRKRRKRNVEMGFRDGSGVFHPIRASSDYIEGGKPKNKAKKKARKAKKRNASKKWISGAIKRPGALRKKLHAKRGKKLTAAQLHKAERKGGLVGREARLAETLRRFKHAKKNKAAKKAKKRKARK